MIDPIKPDYEYKPVSLKRPKFDYVINDSSITPYISIITPFYNAGDIFHETAQSVLIQSFQQWEWLIINDGSTDPKSLEILDAYRMSDSRIKIIDHETNKGLSAARNTGYRNAKSEYILQLDTDDLIEPTNIEKCMWFLESYTEYSFVKGYSVGFGAQDYLWEKGFHNTQEFLEKNLVSPTVMVRKSVYEKTSGYDETNRNGLEDWDFWLNCASKGCWGTTIPEYLDWYRRRANHNERWSNWDDGKNEAEFLQGLREKYRRLWKKGIPKIDVQPELKLNKIFDDVGELNPLIKKRKRVLLLIPWMTLGGADKFNLDMINELIKKDYEVSIITTLNGDYSWLPEFAKLTPDIFILCNFLKFHDYPKFIKYFIKSRDIDVLLISHSEFGYFLIPYLRLSFPDLTVIDYCHIVEEEWNEGGYPRLSVEYGKFLNLNIVSSEHLKSWMINKGSKPDRIEVCYTNIDVNQWKSNPEQRTNIRNQLNIDENLPVILFSGRICEQKQPDVMLKTFGKISREGLEYVGLVAGDGEDMPWLRRNIKLMGLEKCVKLLGEWPNSNMTDLMSASDIYFLPSRWEGIALSLYEAMSCGLPVVSSDVGGQCELVTDDCGSLVSRSNPEQESEKYARILTELILNETKRVKMGKNSRDRICNYFNSELMGNRIQDCLIKASELKSEEYINDNSLNFARKKLVQGMEFLVNTRGLPDIYTNINNKNTRASKSDLRYRLYRSINFFYEPVYRRAKKNGWLWIFPVANKVKKRILGL